MDSAGPTTTPRRLCFGRPPAGPSDFFCYVHLPEALRAADGSLTVRWTLASDDGRFRLSSVDEASARALETRRMPIAAVVAHDRPARLTVELSRGGLTAAGEWPVERPEQTVALRLPFAGMAQVCVGHGLGEAHRTGWEIASQQFGWDFVGLSDEGLGLLAGPVEEPLPVERFAGYGRPIVAPAAGKVAWVADGIADHPIANVAPDPAPYLANLRTAVGNCVVIDHGDVYSCLAHLMKGSIAVAEGQEVAAGQLVGRLGNSGNSTGPHLHLHFMDGPDLLRANPVPVCLDIEGDTYDPPVGSYVSGD